ncbi:MAG TPA: SH3 domain-containing protein [Myxococcales bacterium]|nr:SH3 domain-containing protein [Myxococcales bacterium]
MIPIALVALSASAALAEAPLQVSQMYYTPAEAEALFLSADDAYAREDFAKAREGFEKLAEHGYGGPDVLYNLGTTCLAMGDVGPAVLNLERARRAGGRTEDIEANLALARARQLDRVVGGQGEEPFSERVALAIPENAATAAFLATWSLAFLALAALRFLPARARGAAIAVSVLALLGSAPLGGVVAAHVYVRQALQEGVVLSPSLPARELPREAGKVAFEVHAGLKVRMLEEDGKYVRIRLPNGLEGWTERAGVAPL